MALTFPDRPAQTVGELQTLVSKLVDQLNGIRRVFTHDIDTSETKIIHGLRGAPTFVAVTLPTQATWIQTRPPDDKYVYLEASVAQVKATIQVYL